MTDEVQEAQEIQEEQAPEAEATESTTDEMDDTPVAEADKGVDAAAEEPEESADSEEL